MENTIAERLERLERHLNTLTEKVRRLQDMIVSVQDSANTNSPYSGDAFQSPCGSTFKYQPNNPWVTPPMPLNRTSGQNDSVIEQKLDRLLELLNNNFSRLNFRLEALENERRE